MAAVRDPQELMTSDGSDAGSTDAETGVEFHASALITLEGDLSKTLPEVRVDKLELLDAIDSVDFGDVHLGYRDDG